MFDGARLANIRKYRGMLQKELAITIGVKQNTISAYETNLKTPSDAMKVKIAKELDISLDYLMGLIDIPISYQMNSFIRLQKDFPREGLQKVNEYATLIYYEYRSKK